MKTLLQTLFGAGRIGLLSPALLLLPGNPAKQSPDTLEGVWNIHVVRSMYRDDQLVAREKEYDIATYEIRRNKSSQLEVKHIGIEATYDTPGSFKAWFTPTEKPGIYRYECRFKKPVSWKVQTTARLFNENNTLEYEYFVHQRYMLHHYSKEHVKSGYRLHWHFYWTRDTRYKT